jgi:hypothetical protein
VIRGCASAIFPEAKTFFLKMLFFLPVKDLEERLRVWNEFKLGTGS